MGSVDGNLWLTEAGGSRIGRITSAGVVSEFPSTAAIGAVRLRGSAAVAVRVRCPADAAAACGGALELTI